jgi:homoserine dehydrogenase
MPDKSEKAKPAKPYRVGLLGLGTVGTGTARILLESHPSLKDKTGLDVRLHRIAEKDATRHDAVNVAKHVFSTDALEVVRDPEVDVVVEVIGGIEPARTFILEALRHGKAVVTANKKLLAEHGKELFETALKHHTSIGFEASVCGGVPVIGAIRDGLVANRIETIHGILNGTTNYILTRMVADRVAYTDALREAQQKGYAEADPTLDVKGIDAAHKLVLLCNLAFHSIFSLKEVHIEGIDGIGLEDVRYAAELGYGIKLLAIAKRRTAGKDAKGEPTGLEMRVHPTLIPFNHPLAAVRDVNNAVLVRGDAVGDVMFYGRGAGMMPTGSAIVADILDAARGSAAQTFTKLQFFQNPRSDLPAVPIRKTRSRYYLRFNVSDRPGVVGRITTELGEHEVSLASLIQKEPQSSDAVPIVMLTHQTVEERVRAALDKIAGLEFLRGPSACYRVEDGLA